MKERKKIVFLLDDEVVVVALTEDQIAMLKWLDHYELLRDRISWYFLDDCEAEIP